LTPDFIVANILKFIDICPYYYDIMIWHTPPDEESRKFDIHACFAGMNIKFPFFFGQQNGHTDKTAYDMPEIKVPVSGILG
jgi:hypothetical protein